MISTWWRPCVARPTARASWRARTDWPGRVILGQNAAGVYGIDAARARRVAQEDDLSWLAAAVDEYRAKGSPGL